MPAGKLIILFCVASIMAASSIANAHIWYMKALKNKYDFRGVSCQACHLSRSEAVDRLDAKALNRYNARPKRYYNDFGKQFVSLLAGKEMNLRYDKAREARRIAYHVPLTRAEALREEAERIEKEAVEIFLQTLPDVEAARDPSTGKSYGDLLKAGELDGIRFRTEPRKMPSDD